jgi:hypothetical protein
MKLWLDTEFNGWDGSLISMGIVDELGEGFYEVLECNDPVPWVKEHVIPWLIQEPISNGIFKECLEAYLKKYNEVTVIADWPSDFIHFNDQLLVGAGWMMSIPKINMQLERGLETSSLIPHNAWEDALALKSAYKLKYGD